jgi:hypothetical protein
VAVEVCLGLKDPYVNELLLKGDGPSAVKFKLKKLPEKERLAICRRGGVNLSYKVRYEDEVVCCVKGQRKVEEGGK